MVEASGRVEEPEPGVNVIGSTAYLREDITISDVIMQTIAKPYYTESTSRKQDVTYSPAPDIKIRLAASIFVTIISCCSVVLAETALPFGCMVEPLSWGGFSRLVKENAMTASHAAQNLAAEIQVPIVASALVHVIMRTRKYNVTLRLVALCAVAAWFGSCSNSFVWSPSYLNCKLNNSSRSHKIPYPSELGPGIVVESLCKICWLLFGIRRLLLLNEAVIVCRWYDKSVKVMTVLSLIVGIGAIGIRETFGKAFGGVLYCAAGLLILCILALVLIGFSNASCKLRSAGLSVVDSAMDGKRRAMRILKREGCCISLTLLTSSTSMFVTGSCYLSSSFRHKIGRLKYVVYSVDTMMSAYCFAYLMHSSEERIADFERIQHTSQWS